MTALWAPLVWGGVAGLALMIGGVLGINERFSNRTISLVMALGGGVLVAMVALELMEGAYEQGGYWAAGVGMIAGSLAFFMADLMLAKRGAQHRKESEAQPHSTQTGMAIFVGSLMDSIPEAVAIGVSLLKGGAIGWVLVLGVFLSNIPEGLSATAGMRKAGRSTGYIMKLWAASVVATALAALLGYMLLAQVPTGQVALTQSFAAGAILTMLASTVFPEAFKEGGPVVGLLTSIGFLVAFFLTRLG
jgi:zinc transporter, ZIP family